MNEISCERIEEMLIDYIEGELEREERKIVFDHIARCERCSTSYSAFLSLEKALVSMKDEVPSYKHTLEMVSSKLGIKRENVFIRFIHSPLLPVSLATLTAFALIYISNFHLEVPVSWSIIEITRDFTGLIKRVFSEDIRILTGVNLILLSFFPLLWKKLAQNFISRSNGY